MERYDDQAVYISVMHQAGITGNEVDGAALWAETYNLEHPILANDGTVADRHYDGGWPTYVLNDQEMVIDIAGSHSFSDLDSRTSDLLQ